MNAVEAEMKLAMSSIDKVEAQELYYEAKDFVKGIKELIVHLKIEKNK